MSKRGRGTGPFHTRDSKTCVPERVERGSRIYVSEVTEDSGTLNTALVLTCFGAEPPGANGAAGHFRTHWSEHKRQQGNLALMLRAGGPLPSFKGKVTVRYTRTYYSKPMDPDNMASSFKFLGDALVRLGVIEDDKGSILHRIDAQIPRGKEGPRFILEVLAGWPSGE